MSPASYITEGTVDTNPHVVSNMPPDVKNIVKKRKVCFTVETKEERPDGHTVMAHARKRYQRDIDDDIPDLTLNKQHPYGVKPLGNMYMSEVKCIRKHGLGAFAALDDELFIQFLGELQA
ncbi:hypothetical protein SARC_15211, partial [Sphaeroforma arctica JP610]